MTIKAIPAIKGMIGRVADKALYAQAALIAFALTAGRAEAQGYVAGGGNGIGDVARQVNTNLSDIARLTMAVGFVGGLGLLAVGLLKLKQAADDQGRTKYSEGLWRIGVGAALVALPTMTGTSIATLFTGGAASTGEGFLGR